MANGRCAAQWKHTSAILALLLNVNRSRGTRPVKPTDLDPYHEAAQGKDSEPDIQMKPSEFAKLIGKKKG